MASESELCNGQLVVTIESPHSDSTNMPSFMYAVLDTIGITHGNEIPPGIIVRLTSTVLTVIFVDKLEPDEDGKDDVDRLVKAVRLLNQELDESFALSIRFTKSG